ncbi:MAG: extracellular solute-binding protein [Deltaproteobacteria bacterium]|nr:extracellular solute-binding protein [Deltaproteobacteria bacterium]
MRTYAGILGLVALLGAPSWLNAQSKSLAELANYRGADREQMLFAGAKKEGRLVWYTSLTAHRDIANVFEAKYPGVKLETYRASGNDLTRRILSEVQAKKNLADIYETTPPTLMVLRDSKLLTPYFSPYLVNYPADSKEEADKDRVLWTTDRESIISLGYNRNLIKANEVPKSFADLVKPENKGKIGVSGDSTGVRFIGAVIRAKGEEFAKQLRLIEMKMHMISGGAIHELMAAGEMPMSISIFRNHVLAAKPKGAPTEWVPLDLNPTNAGGVALPLVAANPNGAVLLADFLLSPEGQKIMEERFRFATPTKDYGFKRWYPEKGGTFEQYERNEERWKKLLRDVVVKR